MFYKSQAWNPTLIIAQIVTLQCIFYLTFGSFLYILLGPYVSALALEHGLSQKHLSVHTFSGWMIVVSNILTGLVCAGSMVFVVERAKKCLDFASTIYILHLLVVCIFDGFPTVSTWWVVNLVDLAVVALLSEWLCVQRELQEIPLGAAHSGRRGAARPPDPWPQGLFGRSVPSTAEGTQLTLQRTPLTVVPEGEESV